MSQPIAYNNVNDAISRRYTGFPLNSTLVSSYTPDTIRSIITHAAAGQPYSTSVWIRINRVGIQISAQDPQIARTRIPVFIPIGLVHDIFMLPSINNVICIVYDEVQSNMKGVLLYVVQPSDAQLIRDDFRIVKQANNTQQQQQPQPTVPPPIYTSPINNRYLNTNEIYLSENNRVYTPILSRKSPLSNDTYRINQSIRQQSPRRAINVRDNETNFNRVITPGLPQLPFTPTKGSYNSDRERHRSPRRNRTVDSPTKRTSDSGVKQRKHKSRSSEKQGKSKLALSRSSPDLTQQQQQQQQELLMQQQQLAAWQAAQQMPLIPMGIYNRYVPKTIPLPTGETLKTTLVPSGLNGVATNGTAAAYIEPLVPENVKKPSRSPADSPNGRITHQHRHHRHRRHHNNDNTYNNVSQSPRLRSKNPVPASETDEETKEYLKLLVNEMQAMKMEMNKLRQTPLEGPKRRSDSLQIDLKEIRSNIDLIRSRMAMTPRIVEK